jgi:hypothetical protein
MVGGREEVQNFDHFDLQTLYCWFPQEHQNKCKKNYDIRYMKQRVGDFMYVTWMRQELEYQLDL